MAKHILFLVHGMGKHDDGWSQDTQDLIKKLYGQYPELDLVPFDERFEFKEIRYDGLFEERREQWKSESGAVIKVLKAGGMEDSVAGRLAELAAAPAGDAFFGTHVIDVLLYRFISTIAEQIRVSVAKQLIQTIDAVPTRSLLRWSVLSHSLGTAVSHDTLHALYNTPIPGANDSPLSPADTRPRVIAMVANVSRVLQTNVKVYDSLVRPSIDKTRGLCDYYLSARHQLDVFTIPKQFDPDDSWPDSVTRNAGRCQFVVTSAITDKNVHALSQYLGNPKVHVPLFRYLTSKWSISDEEAKAAFVTYHGETLQGQLENLRQQLKKTIPGENANWKEIVDALNKFFDLIK